MSRGRSNSVYATLAEGQKKQAWEKSEPFRELHRWATIVDLSLNSKSPNEWRDGGVSPGVLRRRGSENAKSRRLPRQSVERAVANGGARMNEKEVRDQLLTSDAPIARKADLVLVYINESAVEYQRRGLAPAVGARTALARLDAATGGNQQEQIREIMLAVGMELQRRRAQDQQRVAARLRRIPRGTIVEIEDHGKQRRMIFLQMNRTRFLAIDQSGQLYTVPAGSFRCVHEKTAATAGRSVIKKPDRAQIESSDTARNAE